MSALQKGANSRVGVGPGVTIPVCVGRGVLILVGGSGVKVLVGVGDKVSVGVGLDTSTSIVDFCSGAVRMPQARIKPTKTRMKGTNTSGVLFIILMPYLLRFYYRLVASCFLSGLYPPQCFSCKHPG